MTKQKINIKNVVFLTILFLIIICGCILRTYIWYHHTDFFCDEASLTKNIITRNYFELFGPLDYAQCCPPIFLILGKLIYSNFGLNERALCSISFSAGILSLFLFTFLTFKVFKHKISILFATLLFSISFPLLICSMFFKQYSFDVLFTIIVLFAVFSIKDKKLSNLQMFFLSLFCIFCVFCSYTAGFLIFLYALFFIFKSFKEKTIKRDLKPFLIFIIPFASVMIWYFFTNCIATINDATLQHYWCCKTNNSPLIFYPKTINQIELYFLFAITHLSDYIQMQHIIYFILNFLVITAFFLLWKFNKEKLYFLFSPFALALFLGICLLYPFAPERVSLYLIPFFFLIIIIPIDEISFKKYSYKYSILSLFILFFFMYLPNLFNFYIKVFKNYDFSDFHFYQNSKTFIETLYSINIEDNSYIVGIEVDALKLIYDKKKKLNKVKLTPTWTFFEVFEKQDKIKKNDIFYVWILIGDSQFEEIINWLKNNNCKEIYKIDGYDSNLIKFKVMSE